MVQKIESLTDYQPGDTVRIRTGLRSGERGTLIQVGQESTIRTPDGELIVTTMENLTNLSLAARRAWATRPKMAGRPASKVRKKMVSMRINEKVWEKLAQAVNCGLISSREQAINEWLAEHVEALDWESCSR